MTEGKSVSVIGGNIALTDFVLKQAALSITGKVVDKDGISR